MQETIFALKGKGGSGKSTTIAYALANLQRHASDSKVIRGRERMCGPREVWQAILTIEGVRVGITSPGDNEMAVRRRVKPLIDAGCQVIVCATRTGGGSVRALKQLASEAVPPFEIQWIKKASDEEDSEVKNRKVAAHVVKKVLKTVAAFQPLAV